MEDFSNEHIAKRSVHGIIALFSRTFILNIVSFIASLVIYTFLATSQVGIYTVVLAIQRVISFFSDFGLGAALVQKKEEITQEDIKTTFTLQFIITLVIFLIVTLFSGIIARSYHLNISGQWLLIVLVFTIFLSSFKTIPSILLERRIEFARLAIPQVIESLVFNILLIIFLLLKFQINSFSIAFLIASLVTIPIYYYVSPWRIQFGIDKKSLHHLKFGSQFQAKNILATIKDDFLTVILARFLSLSEIGYIGFGQRISFFFYRYIVDSATKVLFSSYARMQHDKEFLKTAIEKSLFFVSFAIFPLMLGLIVTIPYIIALFPKWNGKWEPAIVSVIFFSLNAIISSLSGILVNVLDSTGRVKTTLRLMVLWTTLTWILTPILVSLYSFNGVAVASFLVTLTIFYTVYLVKKVVSFSLLKSVYKPAIGSVIMAVFIYFLSPFIIHSLLTLIVVILIGGIIYIGVMYSLTGEQVKNDIRLLLKK